MTFHPVGSIPEEYNAIPKDQLLPTFIDAYREPRRFRSDEITQRFFHLVIKEVISQEQFIWLCGKSLSSLEKWEELCDKNRPLSQRMALFSYSITQRVYLTEQFVPYLIVGLKQIQQANAASIVIAEETNLETTCDKCQGKINHIQEGGATALIANRISILHRDCCAEAKEFDAIKPCEDVHQFLSGVAYGIMKYMYVPKS